MPHKTVSMIEALLTERGVPYKKYEHQPVRTSEEAAEVRPEYSLSQGAKALIVRVKAAPTTLSNIGCLTKDSFAKEGKGFLMLVVPGDKRFDAKKTRKVLGVSDIRFATPEEVSEITDGVESGGVPPFGNVWGLPVYADTTLFENKEIIFNAGDRAVSIAVETDGYQKSVVPKVVSVC